MVYDPDIHHRRSIRLKGYDYRQAGLYYITICVNDKLQLFGQILENTLQLNNAGKMVDKWWNELDKKFPTIHLHEHITMPNHFHGIIQIINPVGADLCVCPIENHVCPGNNKKGQSHRIAPTAGEHKGSQTSGEHTGSPLHEIVQWFKTMTTNDYIRNVKQNNWQPFNGKLWQRNYYEHIIRNEKFYDQITQYIINNPAQWHKDELFSTESIQ